MEHEKYIVLLLDGDNDTIDRQESATLKDAKSLARYMLSKAYFYDCGMNTDYRVKVEIKDIKSGICVYDIFKNDIIKNR